MAQSTLDSGRTYVCRTCDVGFVVQRSETPKCCPVCRMNRLREVGDG